MEPEQAFAVLPRHLAEAHVSERPERFARHALIPGFDQDKLRAATAIVVGVGAVGSIVAMELALVGIGALSLCDPDRVEETNLSRGPLFRPSDVGRLKVDCAAERLREMCPSISITTRPKPFVSGIGLAELRDATLVLGCLDSRAARVSLAGRLGLVRARSIDGATGVWSGEVRPFLDPDGPCYACSLSPSERAQRDAPIGCAAPREYAPQAASAPVSALIGAWMSALALRAILFSSEASRLSGRAIVVDVERGVSEPLSWSRSSECPFHHALDLSSVKRLSCSSSATVGALLRELGGIGKPMVWSPIPLRWECPRGDFQAQASSASAPLACPRCGALLRVRATLDLDMAPEDAVLSEIGVAPREVLAVRSANGICYVELASC